MLADRLGRSFVRPLADLADRARALGTADAVGVPAEVSGPPEVRDLAEALNRLVARVEVLLERERQSVADLSHRLRTPMTALRLRVEGVADPAERERLTADLDELQGMVDHVVREARRSEREGLVAGTDALAVLAERAEFWRPLAEDQDRVLRVDATGTGPVRVRASAADLVAVLDALMDNVFTHTDDGRGRPDLAHAAGRGRARAGGRGRRPGLPGRPRRDPPGHQRRGLDGSRDVDRRGDGRRVRRPPGPGTYVDGRAGPAPR